MKGKGMSTITQGLNSILKKTAEPLSRGSNPHNLGPTHRGIAALLLSTLTVKVFEKFNVFTKGRRLHYNTEGGNRPRLSGVASLW